MTAPIPETELAPVLVDPAAEEGRRASRQTWRAFRRQPLGMASLAILALLVLITVIAPLLAPYPASYGTDVLQPPSGEHWFGTDSLGRDVYAEVIWGTQQSVFVALAASAIAIVFGTLVAVVGAYLPKLDAVIGVVVDLTLSLPVLPLMILVAALVGPSTTTIILVVAAFSWPEVTRLVRSQW